MSISKYLDAKYAEGLAVVGETGSSKSSSSFPKLCDDRLLANRFLRSFSAIYLLRPVPYLLSESSSCSSEACGVIVEVLLLFKKRLE